MVPTLGTESCVPAKGRVTITHDLEALVENMHVEVSGLPKNTDFDCSLFKFQRVPLALPGTWGMFTDAHGVAVGDFVGRFQIGTFIVAPGTAPAPVVLAGDASSNPATAPVQLYHLGLWFDSPAAANAAGCGNKVTPFNSTHNAGVQILNTSNFSNGNGPLRSVNR